MVITHRVCLALLLVLGACTKEERHPWEVTDFDEDGFNSLVDCEDGDSTVHPGADELCNGVDDDCDGAVDEDPVDGTTWYLDADGDDYGDPYEVTVACAAPEGHVADGTDCDDGDPAFHPGATEDDCTDPADYDCDGLVAWADDDGDGWAACEDCDDEDPAIHPGALEVCDGEDNDCDDLTDGADAMDAAPFYRDGDSDGHGLASDVAWSCSAPSGYVADATDCDDENGSVYPGAAELCNGADDDCDEVEDEDPIEGQGFTFYEDVDGDGYGNDGVTLRACELPVGYTLAAGDCDDLEPLSYPGFAEVCDGVDNDCNEVVDDEADDVSTWYRDGDGDGYGDAATTIAACEQPSGYVRHAGDCDDEHDTAHPGRVEVCDELDNDCDDEVDEDEAVDATTWFHDSDRDGYGDPADSLVACTQPVRYVVDDTDCDDEARRVYPGAEERCNERDDDCDGSVDEEAVDRDLWYLDADGDGQGGGTTLLWCDPAPERYVDRTGDCDDLDPSIHSEATEVCDGVDNDCDELVDDEDVVVGAPTWYEDGDGDGWGTDELTVEACEGFGDFVALLGDCDDEAKKVYPGADERCNERDDDCDEAVDEDPVTAPTWYADLDGDLAGNPEFTTEACEVPAGFVADDDDCDDGHPNVYEGADEVCDGLDNDCDELVDDDDDATVGAPTWYEDWDSDGFGDSEVTTTACLAPTGYVADDTDCDDVDGTEYPGADEVCDDEDDDCDEEVDEDPVGAPGWYGDLDGDTYGNPDLIAYACEVPTGFVSNSSDCNDGHPLAYTGADEVCDGVDNDCDGYVDDDDFGLLWGLAPHWYADDDGDGFGDAGDSWQACVAPAGRVATDTDCDDGDASIHPGAVEVCNGVDDDCTGPADESDAVDAPTWYEDWDGDGYGDPAVTTVACSEPAGYVADATDCDDTDVDEYPGAPESCDGYDNDCNGIVDDLSKTLGEGDACAAGSCEDIALVRSDGPGDGVYTIDTDDGDPYEVYCDMSTFGGGWTLLGVFTNNDSDSWDPGTTSWIRDTTFGTPSVPSTNADAKSQAYNQLYIDEVMVLHWPSTVGVVSEPGCIGGNTLQWIFRRHAGTGTDCAWSCGTVYRGGAWTGQSGQDSTLRFRCTDTNGTRLYDADDFLYSGDDNSFITTMSNSTTWHDYNFGLGAGNSGGVDWDNNTADASNNGEKTQVLLYGR